MTSADYDSAEIVATIAERARTRGRGLAIAESLTGGAVASELSRGDRAAEWFRGALIAYQRPVKYTLLGVEEGPVVTPEAARQMARSAASMFNADLVVALTGEAGPRPQEDVPPGTVWIGVYDAGTTEEKLFNFAGDPADIVVDCVRETLITLADRLTDRE